MEDSMPGIANYAQKYHEKHPNEAVKIGFLPSSVWSVFEYAQYYDFAYGEKFYDLSWNHGLVHKEILTQIEVQCVYIHAKENVHENGTIAKWETGATIPPAPVGKNIWGSVVMNERGQLVIPKAVREKFALEGGTRLIVLTDDQEGIALVPAEKFEEKMKTVMNCAIRKADS